MKITQNKDLITEYKNEFCMGFTIKETIAVFSFLSIDAGVTVLLYLKTSIQPQLATFIALPLGIPILLWGFFKYQGYLELFSAIKELRYSLKCKNLSFSSDEEKYKNDIIFTLERNKKKKVKKIRKVKKGGKNENKRK